MLSVPWVDAGLAGDGEEQKQDMAGMAWPGRSQADLQDLAILQQHSPANCMGKP